jgi:SOH1
MTGVMGWRQDFGIRPFSQKSNLFGPVCRANVGRRALAFPQRHAREVGEGTIALALPRKDKGENKKQKKPRSVALKKRNRPETEGSSNCEMEGPPPHGGDHGDDELRRRGTTTAAQAIGGRVGNHHAKEGDVEHLALEDENDNESKKRFEWELEFVQCLASPAYLHFLATYRDDDLDDLDDEDDDNDLEVGETMMEDATTNAGSRSKKKNSKKKKSSSTTTGTVLLQDPHFQAYLRYLRDTWRQPEYAVYLMYPHCLYFLNLLVDHPVVLAREWAQPAYRNFCHHQQFLAWQHRHATLYGRGLDSEESNATSTTTAALPTEANKGGEEPRKS